MVKCSFCGANMEPGTGKLYAKNDGTLFYFCSNKCEVNQMDLKRVPRHIRWTEAFRLARTPTTKTSK